MLLHMDDYLIYQPISLLSSRYVLNRLPTVALQQQASVTNVPYKRQVLTATGHGQFNLSINLDDYTLDQITISNKIVDWQQTDYAICGLANSNLEYLVALSIDSDTFATITHVQNGLVQTMTTELTQPFTSNYNTIECTIQRLRNYTLVQYSINGQALEPISIQGNIQLATTFGAISLLPPDTIANKVNDIVGDPELVEIGTTDLIVSDTPNLGSVRVSSRLPHDTIETVHPYKSSHPSRYSEASVLNSTDSNAYLYTYQEGQSCDFLPEPNDYQLTNQPILGVAVQTVTSGPHTLEPTIGNVITQHVQSLSSIEPSEEPTVTTSIQPFNPFTNTAWVSQVIRNLSIGTRTIS